MNYTLYNEITKKLQEGVYKNTREYPMASMRKTNPDVYQVLMNDYRTEDARIYEEFITDCRKLLESSLGYKLKDAAWQAVYMEAYDRGHSAGFSEVFYILVDLIDLIKNVVDGKAE